MQDKKIEQIGVKEILSRLTFMRSIEVPFDTPLYLTTQAQTMLYSFIEWGTGAFTNASARTSSILDTQ